MKRINKYRRFRATIKQITKKLMAAATCPLGREAIDDLHRMEFKYEKLNEKWRHYISKRVDRGIAKYHDPVVEGNDGEMYSAYDMDMAMMGYHI